MTRPLIIAALLGLLAAVLTSYVLNPTGSQDPVAGGAPGSGAAGARAVAEALPICSAMGLLAEGGDWAALDPDFAAGKRAIAPRLECRHQAANALRATR
jgi:hypothetical protein